MHQLEDDECFSQAPKLSVWLRGSSLGKSKIKNPKSKEKNGLKRLILSLISIGLVAASTAFAEPLNVVASTSDLAAVAKEVGGGFVSVESLCRGDQDPHDFEVLPSQVMIVQQASVYLKVGLALDPWADKLIQSSGNATLVVCDCSKGVAVIGAATHEGPHPLGNPHYWLGPVNDTIVAGNIRDALTKADAAHAEDYARNCTTFITRLDSALTQWRAALAPCEGWGIVSSHPSWDYFARDFGLAIVGTVSRIPDAEPSPVDLANLEQKIRSRSKVLFLREPFTSNRYASVLAKDTGIPILLVPPSVGAVPEAQTLWTFFDDVTAKLAGQCQTSR
jgi:ABC-type Zn uptake system ZnuABC Zn-binding protein ZnuA